MISPLWQRRSRLFSRGYGMPIRRFRCNGHAALRQLLYVPRTCGKGVSSAQASTLALTCSTLEPHTMTASPQSPARTRQKQNETKGNVSSSATIHENPAASISVAVTKHYTRSRTCRAATAAARLSGMYVISLGLRHTYSNFPATAVKKPPPHEKQAAKVDVYCSYRDKQRGRHAEIPQEKGVSL